MILNAFGEYLESVIGFWIGVVELMKAAREGFVVAVRARQSSLRDKGAQC